MFTCQKNDYYLGGKDNYAADRATGDRVIELRGDDVLLGVRANRRFLGRAVRYLVEREGIRQFLDIGTGLPSANNTHEVAQVAAPDSKACTSTTTRYIGLYSPMKEAGYLGRGWGSRPLPPSPAFHRRLGPSQGHGKPWGIRSGPAKKPRGIYGS
jgi:hypothetical protein